MTKQFGWAALAALCLAVGLISAVDAATTIAGRALGHGYFTNDTSYSELNKVIYGGLTATTSKSSFINQIMAKYNGTNSAPGNEARDKTGAEFIIQTMRGSNPAFDHSRPSAADIVEWKARINDSAVTLSTGLATYSYNSAYMAGGANDDMYYSEGGTFSSFIFKVGGITKYVLKVSCGNPVGDFDGLPPPEIEPPDPEDPIDGGGSSVGCQPITISVTPGYGADGNVIPVKVTTTNNSTGTTLTIGTYYAPTVINSASFTNTHTTGDTYEVKYQETGWWVSSYNTVEVKDSDGVVTGYVLVPVYSPPGNWTSAIGPCYAYKLIPSVTVSPDGVVEPGTTYDVKTSVMNNPSGAYHSKSKSTVWQVTKMVIEPDAAIPTANGVINFGPCTSNVYKPPGVTCTTPVTTPVAPVTGSPTPSFKMGYTLITNDTFTTDDLEAGTRICYGLSLKPNASSYPVAPLTDGLWIHSKPSPQPKCLRLGKRPKTQVHSGDLSVGKAFKGSTVSGPSTVQTSTSRKGTNMFGSWIEYGIFATGSVTATASGSAYAGPSGTTNFNFCANSPLSFKNTDASGATCTTGTAVGYSNVPARTIPDFEASFPGSGTAISGTVSANTLASGIYSAAHLTLDDSVLAPGKTVILKVSGTVTITGDQTNNPDNNGSKYTSILQLPQLVIIANDIVIEDGVRNVDAWLIAKGTSGTIKTCSSAAKIVTECSQTLTVNGPVMAKKLVLLRTAGSGTGAESGDPAEIFNLRPDAYLWSVAQAAGQARVQTVYTTELPPRL